MLTGNAGIAALFLFGFMGLEAFTSNSLWFASNGQSAAAETLNRTGLLSQQVKSESEF